MTPLIIYFLKVNIALAVFYLFYKCLFNRDTFFGLRRLMLILICITAVVYPFLEFPEWQMTPESVTQQTMITLYGILLPEVTVFPQAKLVEKSFFSTDTIMLIVYLSGASLLLVRTLLELFRIYRQLSSSKQTIIRQIAVHEITGGHEPYSFFKWICFHPHNYTEREINEILVHEKTHVEEWHSLDILLIQLIIVLCWFNPFAWLIRSEMRINHEFLADKKVVSAGYDRKTYQYHLLGIKHTTMAAANLYNNFSVLPLKKRIKMLNKKRTRSIMKSKYLMFLPVAALLILFSNCANSPKNDASKQETVTDSTNVAPATPAATLEPATQVEPTAQQETPEANTAQQGKIYSVVPNMPTFKSGVDELLGFIHKNIKYPTTAQENGTQGRVIVQFIINTDGSLSDAKIVRGVDPYLDKEALRLISIMPKWNPATLEDGTVVRCKYTLPVTFKLP